MNLKDTEDGFYNFQTVEDETMLLALQLAGEGMTNAEIAYGLWNVLAYFAECETDKQEREGIADLLEATAEDLRTEEPTDTEAKPWMQPEAKANLAHYRLAIRPSRKDASHERHQTAHRTSE